jgi:hypothetical protein
MREAKEIQCVYLVGVAGMRLKKNTHSFTALISTSEDG